MKNELLQLGLQLNVICLEQLKLIVILTPNRPRWDSKPVREIRISSETAYPLHQTTTCIRKGMCLKSIFWEHGKAMGPDGIPMEAWKCSGEEDTYEDAQSHVKTSIGLTCKITFRIGLPQGSSPSPYPCDMIMDVTGRDNKEQPLGLCCLQTILCCAALEETM